MSDRIFLDTNILLYAYDIEACEKRQIAAKRRFQPRSDDGRGQDFKPVPRPRRYPIIVSIENGITRTAE